MMNQFFKIRPFGGFKMIMADPPWSFKTHSDKGLKKSAQSHYECMSIDEIKAMPVEALAAEDSVLWLWTTAPFLPQAFGVIAAWGFTYSTEGIWVKRTKNGKLAFGTGYSLRNSHEPFLIARRGSPNTAKNIRSVIEGPVREHSRKPDEAFAVAEDMIAGHRLELFSGQSRPNWHCFGDETDKFSSKIEGANHG